MKAEVQEKIHALIRELSEILAGADVPCTGVQGGKSCMRRVGDERRKKDGGNVLWYDTDCRAAEKLCPACQAYWHVLVTRNIVIHIQKLDSFVAAAKEREAQQ
jgi:hypothetical protein